MSQSQSFETNVAKAEGYLARYTQGGVQHFIDGNDTGGLGEFPSVEIQASVGTQLRRAHRPSSGLRAW